MAGHGGGGRTAEGAATGRAGAQAASLRPRTARGRDRQARGGTHTTRLVLLRAHGGMGAEAPISAHLMAHKHWRCRSVRAVPSMAGVHSFLSAFACRVR